MAFARNRFNRISVVLDGNQRLEKRENIIEHIRVFFNLYSKDDWNHPLLDNLAFSQSLIWAGPDGFSMFFFRNFGRITEVM